MYRMLILFFLLGSVGVLKAQELSQSIEFEERVFNFGTIEEAKGKVSHTFIFKNKGDRPVEISNINSNCGCIGKLVTKRPVPPGGEGKVTITFDPSYYKGFVSKEIVVFSNNDREYNRIWVEGSVIPYERPVAEEYPYAFGNSLHFRLKVLAVGLMLPGETRAMELPFANDSDEEMDLQFVVKGKLNGQVEIENRGRIAPKERGVLKMKYRMPIFSARDEEMVLVPVVNGQPLKDSLIVRALNAQKPVQLPKRRF